MNIDIKRVSKKDEPNKKRMFRFGGYLSRKFLNDHGLDARKGCMVVSEKKKKYYWVR